jgi:hypothetical protein
MGSSGFLDGIVYGFLWMGWVDGEWETAVSDVWCSGLGGKVDAQKIPLGLKRLRKKDRIWAKSPKKHTSGAKALI